MKLENWNIFLLQDQPTDELLELGAVLSERLVTCVCLLIRRRIAEGSAKGNIDGLFDLLKLSTLAMLEAVRAAGHEPGEILTLSGDVEAEAEAYLKRRGGVSQ